MHTAAVFTAVVTVTAKMVTEQALVSEQTGAAKQIGIQQSESLQKPKTFLTKTGSDDTHSIASSSSSHNSSLLPSPRNSNASPRNSEDSDSLSVASSASSFRVKNSELLQSVDSAKESEEDRLERVNRLWAALKARRNETDEKLANPYHPCWQEMSDDEFEELVSKNELMSENKRKKEHFFKKKAQPSERNDKYKLEFPKSNEPKKQSWYSEIFEAFHKCAVAVAETTEEAKKKKETLKKETLKSGPNVFVRHDPNRDSDEFHHCYLLDIDLTLRCDNGDPIAKGSKEDWPRHWLERRVLNRNPQTTGYGVEIVETEKQRDKRHNVFAEWLSMQGKVKLLTKNPEEKEILCKSLRKKVKQKVPLTPEEIDVLEQECEKNSADCASKNSVDSASKSLKTVSAPTIAEKPEKPSHTVTWKETAKIHPTAFSGPNLAGEDSQKTVIVGEDSQKTVILGEDSQKTVIPGEDSQKTVKLEDHAFCSSLKTALSGGLQWVMQSAGQNLATSMQPMSTMQPMSNDAYASHYCAKNCQGLQGMGELQRV